MSMEVHKVFIRRFLREAFEQGNLALTHERGDMNQVSNGPGALPGMLPEPEGVKTLTPNDCKEFPDLPDAIDEQTAAALPS